MKVEMEEMDPLNKDRRKYQPHKRKPGGGEQERGETIALGMQKPLTLCCRL